jgi:hypothetical protein
MARDHNHELDGKLHLGTCPMCDDIKSRYPAAKKEAEVEKALARHQAVAARSRLGRDAINRNNQGERHDQEADDD